MSAGGKERLTLVLAARTVLALTLSVPGSLRDAWERGGFYLFSREFLLDLPYPGAALLVGPVLIAVPYAAARALANRFASGWAPTFEP